VTNGKYLGKNVNSQSLLFLGLSEFSQKTDCDRQQQVETKKRNRENGETRKLRILAWR